MAGRTLEPVEYALLKALKSQKKDPEAAMATYIGAARSAAQRFTENPDDTGAIRDYNFAVGRIISLIGDSGLEPWPEPIQVSDGEDSFTLTHRPDPRKTWNPGLYDFTPSDEYNVGGDYFKERTLREGVGAPAVAASRQTDAEAHERFAPSRVYYGVTMVARFKGNECEISLEDPLASETTLFEDRRYPLAADFTVPLATMLEDPDNNPKKQGFARYFNPGKFDETARIVGLEPFDPDKTVVLVIHGLTSSQATWTPLINTLRGDVEIRRNFQFWFFSYPSGYPYPYPAMLLRRELERAGEVYSIQKPIVVLGHSMGGCISRLLITDTGDELWGKIFKHSPEDTPLSDASRELLTEALIFEHQPEVGRVIFLSAPLQGSELAGNWIGRIGSRLVKTPKRLLSVGEDAMKIVKFESDELKVKKFPDSVDTLAPNNRFVKAINTIPVTPGIPHHVIAGDRGKGNAPDSSDGVVPYWSSHMDTAASEKIVPSHHGSHQHPEGIEEVRRILGLHARAGR